MIKLAPLIACRMDYNGGVIRFSGLKMRQRITSSFSKITLTRKWSPNISWTKNSMLSLTRHCSLKIVTTSDACRSLWRADIHIIERKQSLLMIIIVISIFDVSIKVTRVCRWKFWYNLCHHESCIMIILKHFV